MSTAKGKRKRADLAGLGCAALLPIEDADGTYVGVSQLCEYAMPAEDMPVGVWHGCEMEALGDEGAIAVDGVSCGRAARACSHDDCRSAQGCEPVGECPEYVWTVDGWPRAGVAARALTRSLGGRG